MTYPAGPGTPVISGVGDMSVDEFMGDPLEIQRVINNYPGAYFITDTLFSGPLAAPTGVIKYNQLLDMDLFIDADAQRQPGDVNPGDEFPAVDVTDRAQLIAVTRKNGGYFAVTDEMKRHDRRDIVAIKLRKLINTLLLISNTKAINAILNDPTVIANCTTATAGIWTGGTPKPLSDIGAAENAVDNGTELGYSSGVGMLHPDASQALQDYLATIGAAAAPREDPNLAPLFNKTLNGVKGLRWIITRRIPRTTMLVVQPKVVGTRVEEIPPFTEVIDERRRQRAVVQSGRLETNVITDPYAVHVTTGIIA